MTIIEEYRTKFPDIPERIMEFFHADLARQEPGRLKPRTVMDFIEEYGRDLQRERPQPAQIAEICSRLERHGWLSTVSRGGPMGLDNRYLCTQKLPTPSSARALICRELNCTVYGFPAVYEHYSKGVVPLINWNCDEDQQIGTCFIVEENCAVTALHCVHPASALAIRGVPATKGMSRLCVFAHRDEAFDLAILLFDEPVFAGLPVIPVPEIEPQVLDVVMALGYPNVPSFAPSLAAEAAQVSGRLTASRGRIASLPTEIFAKAELLLITARVRGGFSGGPVLNARGHAVGLISREPTADANPGMGVRYDELGYGVAIPGPSIRAFLDQVESGSGLQLDMSRVTLREFAE